MEVQPQLLLLQKTLFNIEGLGRELYPELDLWLTAKPFLEDWTRERMSPRATFKRLLAGLPGVREFILESPGRINAILRRLAEDDKGTRAAEEETLSEAARERHRHLYQAAAGGALLLGGLVLLGFGTNPPWLAAVPAVAGAILLLWGRQSA
jgi:ubiquinone biosynthesis protein